MGSSFYLLVAQPNERMEISSRKILAPKTSGKISTRQSQESFASPNFLRRIIGQNRNTAVTASNTAQIGRV